MNSTSRSENIGYSNSQLEISRGVSISWTAFIPIVRGESYDAYQEVWEALNEKSRSPMAYIPSISSVDIMDEYINGFQRRIIRNGSIIIQNVLFDRHKGIIRFEHINDPDTIAIVNNLSIIDSKVLSYSMGIELTEAWSDRAYKNTELFSNQDKYFTEMLYVASTTLKERLKKKGF